MARIRSIKPEFPQSETIGKLSRDARLLFIQLWTIVDDEGRTRAASRMLASLLYPYDDDAAKLIERWLAELERADCIHRYDVDGSHYLEIKNWSKHQKIDRPTASRIPAPLASPREPSRALDADLGPRTLDMDQEGIKEETRASALASADDWPSDFCERFWAKYPNKVGKPDALKKLARARKSGVPWAELWGGLERYVGKTDDRPWCNPATWIHQQRWTDQPANGGSHERRNSGPSADKSVVAAADRLLEKLRSFDEPIGQN